MTGRFQLGTRIFGAPKTQAEVIGAKLEEHLVTLGQRIGVGAVGAVAAAAEAGVVATAAPAGAKAASAVAAQDAAGAGASSASGEAMVTLYHGSKSWVGRAFDLARAVAGKGSYTKQAGIYLTDEPLRAATQYAGPGGKLIVTKVPASFAQRIQQMGPLGKSEYFVSTEADAAILNNNLQILDTMQFLRMWTFP